MSIVIVPQFVNVTPGPPSYSVGPKPPKKSFKFQLKPNEDVDPMDKFDAILEVFGQANLVTEKGKRGRVGMEILLDGKTLLKVFGHYDPSGFPSDQVFSDSATTSMTVRNLTRAHEVTVRELKGTEFNKHTVFNIQLKILDVK